MYEIIIWGNSWKWDEVWSKSQVLKNVVLRVMLLLLIIEQLIADVWLITWLQNHYWIDFVIVSNQHFECLPHRITLAVPQPRLVTFHSCASFLCTHLSDQITHDILKNTDINTSFFDDKLYTKFTSNINASSREWSSEPTPTLTHSKQHSFKTNCDDILYRNMREWRENDHQLDK